MQYRWNFKVDIYFFPSCFIIKGCSVFIRRIFSSNSETYGQRQWSALLWMPLVPLQSITLVWSWGFYSITCVFLKAELPTQEGSFFSNSVYFKYFLDFIFFRVCGVLCYYNTVLMLYSSKSPKIINSSFQLHMIYVSDLYTIYQIIYIDIYQNYLEGSNIIMVL